jgi:hypothetical protein
MHWLPRGIGLLLLSVLPAVISCAEVRPPGKSPLKPARMSPDSVVLDIFFVRFPCGDAEINGPMWDEIDEQQFSSDLRARLAQNGFRVGLVGSQIPTRLAHLLKLTDQAAASPGVSSVNLADLQVDPPVTQEHKQLRAGQRMEIAASAVYDKLPVLTCESGDLCGREYTKAQAMMALEALPEPDGRVRLELTPELHHGEPRQQFVGSQGVLHLDAGRPRRVFKELAISMSLSPGQMAVFTCLPSRSGSLGHHFFTQDTSGRLDQRLIVIRLSQTQHDELFAPAGVLPLDKLANE